MKRHENIKDLLRVPGLAALALALKLVVTRDDVYDTLCVLTV